MSNLAECWTDSCSTYTMPSSGGVSSYSTLIQENIVDAYKNLTELPTILKRDTALKELKELYERCQSVGWDGYDAVPISKSAYLESISFLKKLPFNITAPEIAPEPTGEIGFEWRRNKKHILVLSFGGDKKITFAGVFEGVPLYGTEPFIEQISVYIINLIKKVYKD